MKMKLVNVENNSTEPISRSMILLGLRLSLSTLSCVFILFMIGVIIILRKYKFFMQRLILYLALAALSIVLAACFDFTAADSSYNSTAGNIYCTINGFAQQMALWWFTMSALVISIVVFIQVVLKRDVARFEVLFVLLIFLLPLLINWIPFVSKGYGPFQYYCWIKTRSYFQDSSQKKETRGDVYVLVFYYVPNFVLTAVMFALIMATAAVVRKRKKMWYIREQSSIKRIQEQLQTEVRKLLYFPLVISMAKLVNCVTIIISLKYPGYSDVTIAFEILSIVTFALQGVLIMLIFVLDPDTRNELKWHRLKGWLRQYANGRRGGYDVLSYSGHEVMSDSLSQMVPNESSKLIIQ